MYGAHVFFVWLRDRRKGIAHVEVQKKSSVTNRKLRLTPRLRRNVQRQTVKQILLFLKVKLDHGVTRLLVNRNKREDVFAFLEFEMLRQVLNELVF